MRKYNNILTIIISAVIASACERYIRLDFWENPEVIANGYISTADSVHTVTIIKSDFYFLVGINVISNSLAKFASRSTF